MLDQVSPCNLSVYFHKVKISESTSEYRLKRPGNPRRSLADVIGVHTGGPSGRRAGEQDHNAFHYSQFLDLITRMLDLK